MSTNNLKSLIDDEQFFHHFQPLYHLKKRKRIGYEVLFRSKLFQNPEMAFQTAIAENCLYELEIKNIQKAIYSYSRISGMTERDKLFINVYPSTLTQPAFLKFMHKLLLETHIKSYQIILEINESEVVCNTSLLQDRIAELKKLGYFIAIDDFGKGTASLRALIEFTPDFIKMDRYFADGLAASESKQEMIKSIVTFCESTNVYLIQEGIENQKELSIIHTLGVQFGQGYLLGKPAPLRGVEV
ncbi:EAL domain-containing protein [Oceanobacillus salinisoli]|uniref:EAL domain-containing protein n=1 Tax=Oceanobacillus salinisoli TaxID=2678611 RepID=UPI0012E2FF44|nr:EAL domain-containing protein [Oceanobacillus salinisoli]